MEEWLQGRNIDSENTHVCDRKKLWLAWDGCCTWEWCSRHWSDSVPFMEESHFHMTAGSFSSLSCNSLLDNWTCGPYLILRGMTGVEREKEIFNGQINSLCSPCAHSVFCPCTMRVEHSILSMGSHKERHLSPGSSHSSYFFTWPSPGCREDGKNVEETKTPSQPMKM